MPLTMIFLVGVAFSRTTYTGLLFGMLLTTIPYSFLAAAFSGIVGSYRPGSADAGKPEHLANVFMNESMRAMRSRSILDMGFINLPVKSDFQ